MWVPNATTTENDTNAKPPKPSESGFVGFVGGALARSHSRSDVTPPNKGTEKLGSKSKAYEQNDSIPSAAFSNGSLLASEGEAFLRQDKYARLVQQTLKRMILPDYAVGLIPWLKANHKWIYRILVDALPETIHRQWEQHISLHEFEATLAELLDAQRVALALYQKETRR